MYTLPGQENPCHKVSLLGDASVGKTCLVDSMTKHQFNPNTIPNVGVSTASVNVSVNGRDVQLSIWDTAGQEKYATLLPQPIRDTHIFVICYSIDDKSSFESIKTKWLSLINEHKSENTRYTVIVACKDDLVDQAVVDENNARELANEINAKFHSTSSKTGNGVSEVSRDSGWQN